MLFVSDDPEYTDLTTVDTCALQRLAVDDTMYFHSAWANPKSLKNQFSGVGNVRLS